MNPQESISAGTGRDNWPEALATVIECKYALRAGRALAFGIPAVKHFRIRYNYFADGELHSGEFDSAKALPPGHLFPIRYDPDTPHEHTPPGFSAPNARGALIALGVAGSIVLSLAWLAILRGCS